MRKSKKDEAYGMIILLLIIVMLVGALANWVLANIIPMIGMMALMAAAMVGIHLLAKSHPWVAGKYTSALRQGAKLYSSIRAFHRNAQKLNKQSSSSSQLTPEQIRQLKKLLGE